MPEHELGVECDGPCEKCDRIAEEIGRAYAERDNRPVLFDGSYEKGHYRGE